VDVYIGARIRDLRLQLGLPLQGLAEKLAISAQQLHNYEQGRAPVSAARLFDICEFFGVSLASMFERQIKE
jgi:transcriptional regulator with XRE-family HTH domain